MFEISINDMTEKDIDTVYKYLHSHYVNKYFKDTQEQYILHSNEYKLMISSSKYQLYVAKDINDNFISIVIYEIVENKANVKIFLNKVFREKHLAEYILNKSIEIFKNRKKEIKILEAYILEENINSQKLFLSQDFSYSSKIIYKNIEYLLYEKKLI